MKKITTKEELRKEIARRFDKKNRLGYYLVDVAPGTYHNIGHCHYNVRQALEMGTADYGAEVIQLTKKGLIRYHFVEAHRDPDNQFTYIDNTLGYLANEMTYFLVKNFTLKSVHGKDMTEVIQKAKTKFLKQLFTKKEIKNLNIEYGDL